MVENSKSISGITSKRPNRRTTQYLMLIALGHDTYKKLDSYFKTIFQHREFHNSNAHIVIRGLVNQGYVIEDSANLKHNKKHYLISRARIIQEIHSIIRDLTQTGAITFQKMIKNIGAKTTILEKKNIISTDYFFGARIMDVSSQTDFEKIMMLKIKDYQDDDELNDFLYNILMKYFQIKVEVSHVKTVFNIPFQDLKSTFEHFVKSIGSPYLEEGLSSMDIDRAKKATKANVKLLDKFIQLRNHIRQVMMWNMTNEDHLFLHAAAENAQDMLVRG